MALLALLFVSIGAFIAHPTPLGAAIVLFVAVVFAFVAPKLVRGVRKLLNEQLK